ncbi:MAG: hypothetical protein ABIJ56_07915 [Pseudomonadota bacterium]
MEARDAAGLLPSANERDVILTEIADACAATAQFNAALKIIKEIEEPMVVAVALARVDRWKMMIAGVY